MLCLCLDHECVASRVRTVFFYLEGSDKISMPVSKVSVSSSGEIQAWVSVSIRISVHVLVSLLVLGFSSLSSYLSSHPCSLCVFLVSYLVVSSVSSIFLFHRLWRDGGGRGLVSWELGGVGEWCVWGVWVVCLCEGVGGWWGFVSYGVVRCEAERIILLHPHGKLKTLSSSCFALLSA